MNPHCLLDMTIYYNRDLIHSVQVTSRNVPMLIAASHSENRNLNLNLGHSGLTSFVAMRLHLRQVDPRIAKKAYPQMDSHSVDVEV